MLILVLGLLLVPAIARSGSTRFIGCWDEWQLFGPNAFFLDHSIQRGEFPFWNPHIFCGTPFAADPQALAFYPPNLMRSAATVSPTPLRSHLGIAVLKLAHLLIAGTGAYVLARYHGLSRSAAYLAAFVFVLSWRYLLAAFALQVLLYTTAWVPWLLLTLYTAYDALTPRIAVRRTLAAGVLLGLVLLAGYPQLATYAIAGSAVALAIHAIPPRFAVIPQATARYAGIVVGACFIGMGSAAALILPAMELVPLSTRGLSAGIEAENGDFFAWRGVQWLFEFIIVFNGIGAGATLLALFGIAIRPSRRTAIYAVFAYLMLDFAMGPPFPASSILEWAAPFRFSFYLYALHLLPLPMGMLAGMGLDALQTGLRKKTHTGIAAAGAVAAGVFFAQAKLTESFVWVETPPGDLFTPLALTLLLAGGVVVPWRITWAPAAVVLVVTELLIGDWRYIEKQYVPESQPFPGRLADLRKERAQSTSNYRSALDTPIENTVMYDLRHGIGGYNALILADSYSVLSDPLYEASYWRAIGGQAARSNTYWRLFLKRRFWLASRYVDGALPGKETLFPTANTVFLQGLQPKHVPSIDRAAVPNTAVSSNVLEAPLAVQLAPADTNEYTLELPSTSNQHRALAVRYRSDSSGILDGYVQRGAGQKLALPTRPLHNTGDDDAWTEIPLPDTEHAAVILRAISDRPEASVQIVECVARRDLADEGDRIAIVRSGANSVSVRVTDLPGHRLLVFVEARYPGWSATVDGEPARILPANDAFMAVELPPGTHDVMFSFSSSSARIGIAMSLATAAMVIAGLAATLWPRRKHSETT